jgi:hypothetical protein
MLFSPLAGENVCRRVAAPQALVAARRFCDGLAIFFIRTPKFGNQVLANGSTNYASIRPADVLRNRIPLPPFGEQQRIVAWLDELRGSMIPPVALRPHRRCATS